MVACSDSGRADLIDLATRRYTAGARALKTLPVGRVPHTVVVDD